MAFRVAGNGGFRPAGGAVLGTVTLDGVMSVAAAGRILLDDGTAALPALSFAADPDTGLYRTGANTAALAANGALAASIGSAVILSSTLTSASNSTFNSAFRIAAETVKVADYQVASADAIVIMNGVSLVATMPASPGTSQMVWIVNIAATSVTVARNGKTINGVAADDTLLTMTARLYQYDGTGWYKLN